MNKAKIKKIERWSDAIELSLFSLWFVIKRLFKIFD
ncbi:hypothetical protein PQE75_gp011 [Bacillus phage vB_BcoS-136]|uniref:Uncharacterized protein n=1 Tax=Bacillus phage vB_BcoS-136 TaxID=2419619 RepID=A0A3G3BV94_9CAUD|nr:hypothetical protein PQE75_gp011 [Bacillus phage vB_BcoS-136]AYP68143.1 hypothetical protein vBBcoS136_00011 [Bacillus phage vB_BcoS-136]